MAKQVFVSQILPSPASQPMGQKLVLWHAELKIINLLWMLPFDKSFLVNRNGNQIFHFHIMIALACDDYYVKRTKNTSFMYKLLSLLAVRKKPPKSFEST